MKSEEETEFEFRGGRLGSNCVTVVEVRQVGGQGTPLMELFASHPSLHRMDCRLEAGRGKFRLKGARFWIELKLGDRVTPPALRPRLQKNTKPRLIATTLTNQLSRKVASCVRKSKKVKVAGYQ